MVSYKFIKKKIQDPDYHRAWLHHGTKRHLNLKLLISYLPKSSFPLVKANFRRKNIKKTTEKPFIPDNSQKQELQEQKQQEPVHQWRKSKKQQKSKNNKKVKFDPSPNQSEKVVRSATISDTSDTGKGNELRLAATILGSKHVVLST